MVARDDEGAATSDRELVFTRVFEAPRELVWQAWTDVEHVAQWWGPSGFTTTTHEMDVRQGGVWRFIMHGPDGTDYPNKIVYTEVEEPERLAYDHSGDGDEDGPRFRVVVTFADLNGRTELAMKALFESAAERDRHVEEYGAVEGGNQTLARLAEHLTKM